NVRLAHPPGSSDALADAVRAPAKQALQTKTVIMTDLHGAPADGHAHLDLLIPLVVRREASTEEVPPAGTAPSPADRSAGLLVLQVNAHDFLFPLIQSWPASTRTAETLLVRREGNEVLYLNELRHLPGTALKLRRPLDDPRLPAAMGLRGEKSVQQGVDYRGVPVVATARPIPDTPWVMVAKVDEAELYAPLRQQALFVVAIALALLLAAALGITVLWRRRNEHFLQAQLAAERELARAGRDWQTTFDAANDAIWTLDSQHRVLRSNRTAERFFHRPCGEMIGQPCWAIVHGTTQPLPECPVLRARKSLQRETMELRLADRVFEVCVDPILDDQGQYAGAVHIVSDITQRKAHEAEIERLNRLYATLSQVNQAVVRVKSREELAAEVSRVAVAFGGFKLAWVGQHHAETGAVTPVGSAGEPHAFVHDLRHSTADDAGHRCFCVPVIRENRPCVANNLAALREMHDQASAIIPAGIQAAAVIPIRVRGAVWGVFGVYSGEPDVFLEKEIALLEEAAMDVGYAIEHLDTEARRQAAETALRESEAQFKCFFEHSNVGKSITRPSGEVQVNQAFADLLGYSPAELENRTWQEVTHPEDVASTQQVVDALLAGERDSARFTKRYLHKNGSVVWADVSTTLRRDAAEQPLYFMTTVMDITARQKAEAAQARLLHILESSLNEIYVFKADNLRFEYVNLGALRNLGYTLEALRQMTPLDLKPEFDRAKFDQIIEPLLRREKPLQLFETVHRRADGSLYPVEVRLQLFEHEGDRVFLAVIQDLTERKRLEQERQAMEAQLRQQQKLESIGTLASGVAHEINNPITGIMNYAQLIQDRLPADSPLTEFTGEIMHETQRVAGIVRNLLTFARNEKQSHSPAQIADIVEGTLSLIRTVIRHDQITLTVNVPEDLPQLKCRSQQIQQVLMNLMTNARDALNERYPGHDPDKVLKLEVNLFEKEGRRWIRVTVEDHGTGIPPEVRERMFDPFFTTKPRDKGTGLGLAISHGIVKEHHGRLTVESEPGRFTRMHLELPVDNGWSL
ncbi:MAG TPA: PAS domain S-box protein, partial [Verrucomicrobiae bacterium]